MDRLLLTSRDVISLSERLAAIGLDSEYLKKDSELFEVYRKKLNRGLEELYHALLEFLTSEHYVWQKNTMWIMLKRRPTDENTYDQTRKAISTPQPNDEYDYETAVKGPTITGQNEGGPDTLRMPEHEVIQSEFHPEPEQVEAFYKNAGVGVNRPSPIF